jgi:hypothetical protein
MLMAAVLVLQWVNDHNSVANLKIADVTWEWGCLVLRCMAASIAISSVSRWLRGVPSIAIS